MMEAPVNVQFCCPAGVFRNVSYVPAWSSEVTLNPRLTVTTVHCYVIVFLLRIQTVDVLVIGTPKSLCEYFVSCELVIIFRHV